MIMEEIIKKLLGEKFSGIIGKGLDKIVNNFEYVMNNNVLEYLCEEYNRNYYTKTLLHRVTPVKLFDIYQPLYITPSSSYLSRRKIKQPRTSTSSIMNLFENNQYIILNGNAGSGKSTIVKYLFVNAIQTEYKIPIKIELRYLNDYGGNLINFVQNKIFKFQGLANSDEIIEQLMQSGKFVFFLDGYDEIISSKKQAITKDIDDFVKLYNKNNYLLTSRPFTDIDMLPLFNSFDVCDLSEGDIDEFIKKQIPQSEIELSTKIIEAVHSQENSSYKSFLSNPLLLSMFILTFQSYSNIPQRRSDFYNQVFETLYSLHDSVSKMSFVREKQSGLSKEYFIEILKLYSFISYFDEKFTFSSLYIEEKLQLIKGKKNLNFDNQKLIDDLQIAIGILSKEGTDYTYPHRSLQEYFAAMYISSLSETNKAKIYDKIDSLMFHYRNSERESDNFYLLLSELDRRGVVKYAILPFLDNMIVYLKNNIDNDGYGKIIERFSVILRTYSSFCNILDKTDLCKEDSNYNIFFRGKVRNLKQKSLNATNEEEQENEEEKSITERAREELAIKHIKPFLKSFISKMEKTRKDLDHFLYAEEAIDSDFIDLA